MKTLFYILLLLFPAVLTAQQPRVRSSSSDINWMNVGNPGFSDGLADYSNIVIGPDQMPYTAFNDNAYGMRGCVMKYDGSGWEYVGTPGFTPAQADRISLALSLTGEPYIAFLDYSVNLRTSVMKYNGSGWEYVGDTGFSYTNAEWPRIAFSPSGEPFVSFIDEDHISVMKYDGSQWTYVGPRQFSGLCWYDDMAFSPSDGMPYVAYSDSDLGGRATLDKFDGTDWTHVGDPGFSAGGLTWLNLAFDQSGQPFAGYCDFEAPDDALTVMTFNGTDWENVGEQGFNPGWPLYPAMAIGLDNMPCIAWEEYFGKVSAMKFNGSEWIFIGNQNFSAGGAQRLDMAIDSSGRIYVAYSDGAYDGKETVMKYDTVSVGVPDRKQTHLSVYPNPASDKITIEKAESRYPDQLFILNPDGKEMLRRTLTGRITAIDISDLPAGMYMIRLVGEHSVQVSKIVRK